MSCYGKLPDINENQAIFRRIIEAYLLKFACKIVHSVKGYDKTNFEILTVSLWKYFSWGLTYFDQFIWPSMELKLFSFVITAAVEVSCGSPQSVTP